MGNEEVGQKEIPLQVLEQIQYLKMRRHSIDLPIEVLWRTKECQLA
jgi:hypothetical protein